MNKTDNYQMNLTVSYARQFGLHNVNGLFSIEKAESEYEYLTGTVTDPFSFTDGQSNSTATGADQRLRSVVRNRVCSLISVV